MLVVRVGWVPSRVFLWILDRFPNQQWTMVLWLSSDGLCYRTVWLPSQNSTNGTASYTLSLYAIKSFSLPGDSIFDYAFTTCTESIIWFFASFVCHYSSFLGRIYGSLNSGISSFFLHIQFLFASAALNNVLYDGMKSDEDWVELFFLIWFIWLLLIVITHYPCSFFSLSKNRSGTGR